MKHVILTVMLLGSTVFAQSYDPNGGKVYLNSQGLWIGGCKSTSGDCDIYASNVNVYIDNGNGLFFSPSKTKEYREYKSTEEFKRQGKITSQSSSQAQAPKEVLSDEMYNAMWQELSEWQMNRIWKASDESGALDRYDTRKKGDGYGDHWYRLTKESRAAWYEYLHRQLDLPYMERTCRAKRYKDAKDRQLNEDANQAGFHNYPYSIAQ